MQKTLKHIKYQKMKRSNKHVGSVEAGEGLISPPCMNKC